MSWQARILLFIFKILRLFAKKGAGKQTIRHHSEYTPSEQAKKAIIAQRRQIIWSTYLIPTMLGVKYKRFEVDGLPMMWVHPRKSSLKKVILYFHGGAYTMCNIKTHFRMVTRLCRFSKVSSLMVDYRLAPEHPYPAALDDAMRSYNYLLDQGYAPEDIIIGGDSAGGGLTLATMLKLRDNSRPMPAGGVLLSPWTDLGGDGASHHLFHNPSSIINRDAVIKTGRIYAGETPVTHPYISPVYADLAGLPPLFTQVSNHELLRDDAVRIHENALKVGVNSTLKRWDNMIHVWQVVEPLPESKKALKQMAGFVQERFSIREQTASKTDAA